MIDARWAPWLSLTLVVVALTGLVAVLRRLQMGAFWSVIVVREVHRDRDPALFWLSATLYATLSLALFAAAMLMLLAVRG